MADFAPLQFVPVFGSGFTADKFKNSTLVLPTTAVGMNSMIAAELFICNEQMTKAGFLHSEYIAPLVFNDAHSPSMETPGKLTMPCEIYQT